MKKFDTALGLLMVMLIGFAAGGLLMQSACEKDAVKQGFAEYNPTNKIFQWKK